MYLGFERYLNLITKRFMLLCMNAWGKGNRTKEDKNKHTCWREFISTANIAGKRGLCIFTKTVGTFLKIIIAFMALKL